MSMEPHNFVANKIVTDLQLPLSDTAKYGVVMGNGNAIKGKGICKKISLLLQGLMINEDFLLLELGGDDFIMGMSWLTKMGFMSIDWATLTMSFLVGAEAITLKEDPTLTKVEVSLGDIEGLERTRPRLLG